MRGSISAAEPLPQSTFSLACWRTWTEPKNEAAAHLYPRYTPLTMAHFIKQPLVWIVSITLMLLRKMSVAFSGLWDRFFLANREVGISRGKRVRLYKVVLQLKSVFFFAFEKIQINYKNKRNLKGIMTLSVNLNQLISTRCSKSWPFNLVVLIFVDS